MPITQFHARVLAALIAGHHRLLARSPATILALLGPIFIPFMVFEKTEFLFWDG